MTDHELLAIAPAAAALATAAVVGALRSERAAARAAGAGAGAAALLALASAAWTLAAPTTRPGSGLVAADVAGAVPLATVAVVGLASVLVTRAPAAGAGALFRGDRGAARYRAALLAFWGLLLAVPVAGNLGAAWLLVEATTAASALLVASSGRRRALEAAWKYLVLTALGLGIAFLGLIVLQVAEHAAGVPRGLGYGAIARAAPHLDRGAATLADVLLLVGLAAKAGLAPVHNWLPDAHSEAPAPVSALLSAALLPSVLSVAWRVETSLGPATSGAAHAVPLLLGLASLAVAVPFLWRPLPYKRLLAYSSLEHMGVIAVGLGFATPLALAGVSVHIAGHAVAKSLGFYTAGPLAALQPATAAHAPRGVARADGTVGAALGVSLGALAALPPSPLFVSEVMIVAGGFEAGRTGAAVLAAVLLALGFLGVVHALLDALAGRQRPRGEVGAGARRELRALLAVAGVLLVALTVVSLALPGSEIAAALVRGPR